MKKRETVLLAVLGAVVVVAIIIFLAASSPATPAGSEQKSPVVAATDNVMATLASTQPVLRSDKFLTLTTYGKIPVVVEPFEMGNKQPINPAR